MWWTLFAACTQTPNPTPDATPWPTLCEPQLTPEADPTRGTKWATDGARLLVSSDQGLQVFTRDGEGWQDRGRWPLGVEPDDLAIDGDLAVVVAGDIHVVDLGDPDAPTTLATLPWDDDDGPPDNVWLSDGLAAVVDTADSRISVLDLADPTAPAWVAYYDNVLDIPSRAFQESVCIMDRTVYALVGDHPYNQALIRLAPDADPAVTSGELIVDARGIPRGLGCDAGRLVAALRVDPGGFHQVSSQVVALEPLPDGNAMQVDVLLDVPFSGRDSSLRRAQDGVAVIQVDPSSSSGALAVVQLDPLALVGVQDPVDERLDTLWVEQGVVWVRGADTIERLEPGGGWGVPLALAAYSPGFTTHTAWSHGYALTVDGATVRAYAAGNGPPELVTETLLEWQVAGLTVGEGWVAAADDDGSVVVMSAAPDLQVLATLDLGVTLDIVGAGSHLLVSGWEQAYGIDVFDLSDPATPALVDRIVPEEDTTIRLAASDAPRLVFLQQLADVLTLFEVDAAGAIAPVGEVQTPRAGGTLGFDVGDHTLWVLTYGFGPGLEITDETLVALDLDDGHELSRVPVPGAVGLAADGYLVAVATPEGVWVVGRQKDAVQVVGFQATPTPVEAVALQDGIVAAAAGHTALATLSSDCSDP